MTTKRLVKEANPQLANMLSGGVEERQVEITIEGVPVLKNDILTDEEGYVLTKKYVNYFWNVKKFYSLERDFTSEDMVHHIYAKFLEKEYFSKYSRKVTTKKYFIMIAVKRAMIDELRKQREQHSLDKENEDGLTMLDIMESPDRPSEQVIGRISRNYLLENLPGHTNSKVIGYSPLLGECNMSLRNIALHLEAGYKPVEIASFYINPTSGKHVTEGRIHQLINDIKERLSSVVSVS